MPHINRIRVNNVKYNFGTQYYDDFVMRFSGKNTIYDLANGGGKSVLMLLLLQNLIPNCTLDEKQPIEKLFRSGNGNTTIHSMIEWKLNPCHIKNGFQYMTTGFCARKARSSAKEEGMASDDRAAIDYFNYCIFYRQFNDNDLKNLPLSNGKERITYLGLRAYLQELEKKDLHVEVHIFDGKGEYQRFISRYGLFESEWEIIRGINKTEGHVRTYFETNYRTTRKVVEDLLIEEIIEKSFYHKAGKERENSEMAATLLELKDQLLLLSRKKNEIHYYDRQMELLEEFASRVESLSGMYAKKQGLEEQLVKTYRTTLERRKQKEHAHQELTDRGGILMEQTREISRQIDTAGIKKRELKMQIQQEKLAKKQQDLTVLEQIAEKKQILLEDRECDNHYLNYLEYEKEYQSAKAAADTMQKGSGSLEDDLFAMANELQVHVREEQEMLAGIVRELEEQAASLEEERKKDEEQEKELSVTQEVLMYSRKRYVQEREKISAALQEIFQKEGILIFSDMKSEYLQEAQRAEKLEQHRKDIKERLESCKREIYGAEVHHRSILKEERRITAELENMNRQLSAAGKLQEQMDQIISIYGGTYESVENVLAQRQKEQILSQEKNVQEKKRLQARLAALSDGIHAVQPEETASYLEEISRYYDEKAISGYEYLCRKEKEEREILLERYPMLPYGIVTSADLEGLAADRKFKEKDFGDLLLPIISKDALEKEKELTDERFLIFAGRISDREKIRERLEELETFFARSYETERVLKRDYDFVRMYLQQRTASERMQEDYARLRSIWKQQQTEREEEAGKIRLLKEETAALEEELTSLDAKLKEKQIRMENLRKIMELEESQTAVIKEENEAKEAFNETKEQLQRLRDIILQTSEELYRTERTLEARRGELKHSMEIAEALKNYVNEKEYPAVGLSRVELENQFLGKKAAYEQKNADIADKQKLAKSYEKSMEQQRQQLLLLGRSVEQMRERAVQTGCIRTEVEEMMLLKKEVFNLQEQKLLAGNEIRTLEAEVHQTLGSIRNARQMAEEKYGSFEMPEILPEQLDGFIEAQKEQKKRLEEAWDQDQKMLRDLEEQCYALKAMAQDMERMMKSAGIDPEGILECLELGMSLKEQYENLRQSYEKIVKEEAKRLETTEKEKEQLTATLEKMGAYELSEEIRKNLGVPENEQEIQRQIASLKSAAECLELEKNRIEKDLDSLQDLKDQFEAQCLQNCLNIKEELDRLQKLSRISIDQQMISVITLQIPYIKEELYGSAMSEYIDRIIRQVETIDTQAERLNFIRDQLAFKRLFSVIVANMDAIRLTLYKRERMKEQSRYLRYEEAVGSTGQSQGIYIQFLVAIINYISSINSGNADPMELKKVIFIDNPFGAAKDVYIWEPIFKLLKANNVQLIVPARGATPAITGRFEVNYILGQKLIDGRQQTVVVDYRSQTRETELEYLALDYEQETLQFL